MLFTSAHKYLLASSEMSAIGMETEELEPSPSSAVLYVEDPLAEAKAGCLLFSGGKRGGGYLES